MKNARILDLTDPKTAEMFGYKDGMEREDVLSLLKDKNFTDITQIDAIKYKSVKTGRINYAIKNPAILEFKGITMGGIDIKNWIRP